MVVDGTIGGSDNKLVSNFGSGIKEVGISQNDDGSWGGVKILNGAHVETYKDAIANVKGGVVVDGVGTLVQSEWGGVWTINTIGGEKDGAGNYSGVTISGGAKVQDKCVYGSSESDGGAISNVYGGVVVTGSGTEVSSVQGIGIKDVGISQNDDGSWGGVKILNGALVETYQDSITNVKGDVAVDGAGTLVQSQGVGIWTINNIGREEDGTGNVTVSGGAKVQDKYDTVHDGGAINNVYGNVVVTGSGTEVSSVQANSISEVKGDVTISEGAKVSAGGYAVEKVGGSVAVSNGSELKGGIYDVTGNVTALNSAVSAKDNVINTVGGNVVIDHSQISSTDAYAVNKVLGGVEVSNGSELKGGIYDVQGSVKIDGINTLVEKSDASAISGVAHGDVSVLNGAEVQSTTSGIEAVSEGNVIVDSAVISGDEWGIYNVVKGNVTIQNGATVSGKTKGAVDKVGGDVVIDHSQVSSAESYVVGNVTGGVTLNGATTVIKSAVKDVATINNVGGLTVSGGAKVQDAYDSSETTGGAVKDVKGNVVVTGTGSEVSSKKGFSISDVTGNVSIQDGASVSGEANSAINTVGGDVLVDGGKVTAYKDTIANVSGGVNLNGATVTFTAENSTAINVVGKDVSITGSTIIADLGKGIEYVGYSTPTTKTTEAANLTVTDSTISSREGAISIVTGSVTVTGSGIDSTAVESKEGVGIDKVYGAQATAADGDMGVTLAGLAADKRVKVKAYNAAITDVEHGVRAQYADITSTNGTAILNVGDEDGRADATGNTKGNLWLDNVIVAGYEGGIDTIFGNATIKSSIVVSTNGIGIANTSGSVTIDGYSSTNVNDTPVTASVFASGDAINMVGKDVNANGSILVSSNGNGIVKVNGDVNLNAVDLSAKNSAITDVEGNVIVKDSTIKSSNGNGIESVEGNVVAVGSTIIASCDGINRTNDPSGEGKDWIQSTIIDAKENGINLINRGSQNMVMLNNVDITTELTGISADEGSYVYLTDMVLDGTAVATAKKGDLSILLKANGGKDNEVIGISAADGSIVDLAHGGDVSIKLNKTGDVYDTVEFMTAIKANGKEGQPPVVFFKDLEVGKVVANCATGVEALYGARIGGVKDGNLTWGTLKATAGLVVESTGEGDPVFMATALHAYGEGSQIMLDMQGGSIKATANKSYVTAIWAEEGASIEVDKAKDIIATGKEEVVAISAWGSNSFVEVDFDGSSLKAISTDNKAHGVEVTKGGTVVIEDANGKVLDMEVKGQNAAVVYSDGGDDGDDNNVSITNANVIVEATAEDGYQNLLKVENGGTTNLTLDNVTVMGAPKAGGGVIAGSDSLLDVTPTDIEVTDAVANVKLYNHSSFNGKVEANGTGVITMSLDNTSTWGVTDTCKVDKLFNYGLVDMTVDNKYGTGLTVDELAGNGKIAMDVDFEAVDDVTKTDVVEIVSVVDNIRINVLPRFENLLTGEAVLIFTGDGVNKLNSGNVVFNGESVNGANKIDYGAFRYSAEFTTVSGAGWLTMLPDWKGTDVVLSAKGNAALSAVIDPETWYQDTEALFDNMDEFDANRAEQQIWAKYTNKKNTYDESFKGAVNNSDIDKKYNGVVVGWDNRAKHFEKANADLYVGTMLTYGSGRYNWNGGSNDLDGEGVGLYTVYKTAKGAYIGATVKYNRYNFDEIKGNQDDGFNTPFKGDYSFNAYGIDLAAGRRYAKDLEDGFYVEPQIGLGYVRYNNGGYDLDGMDVDVNGMASLRGRFGVQFGTHKLTGKGGFYDIFARVTLNREFKGRDDVKLDRAYNFEVDQSGTWVNFAIGTRVGNMNKFNADLNANLSRGKHESKVGFKIGLNFMF